MSKRKTNQRRQDPGVPAARDQPSGQQARRFDLWSLLPAGVAAAAAILGALVGGYVSNEGNRQLQEDESRQAARGAARVYQGQFATASLFFETIVENGIFVKLPDQTLGIPADQEQLIATHVSAREWQEVTAGQILYDFVVAFYANEFDRADRGNEPVRLTKAQRDTITQAAQRANESSAALSDLSDIEP